MRGRKDSTVLITVVAEGKKIRVPVEVQGKKGRSRSGEEAAMMWWEEGRNRKRK